jgi:Tfp pilus assembly protein PilE
MEQSNLLELAKRGEPEAIAALMNAVLEAKGIHAQATVEHGCLHVLLESSKSLNQNTITGFIQRGLAELEIQSLSKVRASGKRLNEKKIAWTREFSLLPTTAEHVIAAMPVPSLIPVTLAEPEIASKPAIALDQSEVKSEVPRPEPSLVYGAATPTGNGTSDELEDEFNTIELPPHLLLEVEPPQEYDLPLPEHLWLSDEPDELLSPAADLLPEHLLLQETPEEAQSEEEVQHEDLAAQGQSISLALQMPLRDAIVEELQEAEPEGEEEAGSDEEVSFSRLQRLMHYSRSYALPVLLVGVGSFFAGGTAAFLSTSQTKTQTAANEAVFPQPETPETKQQEAEAYLKAMNAAQEKFYKQNNRFATSLEELERSANIISQSYSYAYRLQISNEGNGGRAVISAAPRESGLKSYAAAVSVAASKAVSAAICQTKKPTREAPMAPEFSSDKVSCDARSTKLP